MKYVTKGAPDTLADFKSCIGFVASINFQEVQAPKSISALKDIISWSLKANKAYPGVKRFQGKSIKQLVREIEAPIKIVEKRNREQERKRKAVAIAKTAADNAVKKQKRDITKMTLEAQQADRKRKDPAKIFSKNFSK